MTYDNGMDTRAKLELAKQMANHKWLSNNTGMQIFFANPFSSFERGTNENKNGLTRRFFPKKTDFNTITIEKLKHVQNTLNKRPRKVLGYKTLNGSMKLEITVHQKLINLILDSSAAN